MKLPWENTELKEKIEELEASIEEKDEEISRLESMLEAEKERRKKHTREKQNAQEKVNRLEDQLEGLEDEDQEEHSSDLKSETLSFKTFRSGLRKINSVRSDSKDLVTIYSPGKLAEHGDLQQIKNTLPDRILKPLMNANNLILLYDPDLGLTAFKANSLYDEKFVLSDRFKIKDILEFISEKKNWALVSRGNTKIYTEEDGEFEELESLKSRVNRQHGKGGFSQGRFERKRDEQVKQHLDQVKDALEELDNLYILGDQGLCKELKGKYITGFDPNSSALNNFYRPRRLKISEA